MGSLCCINQRCFCAVYLLLYLNVEKCEILLVRYSYLGDYCHSPGERSVRDSSFSILYWNFESEGPEC